MAKAPGFQKVHDTSCEVGIAASLDSDQDSNILVSSDLEKVISSQVVGSFQGIPAVDFFDVIKSGSVALKNYVSCVCVQIGYRFLFCY